MWVAFANAKATHIFSAKILAYMPYLKIKVFNGTLTNDIVSFEQLGPERYLDLPSVTDIFIAMVTDRLEAGCVFTAL